MDSATKTKEEKHFNVVAAWDYEEATVIVMEPPWGGVKLSIDYGGSDINSYSISKSAGKAIIRLLEETTGKKRQS